METLIFATRPSALARWQTRFVIDTMQMFWPGLHCEERIISTQGDHEQDKPLPEIGGKGLFTYELETELQSGNVHAAVHSLKDMPVEPSDGLVIGCIPARGEVRDALVCPGGLTLETLPHAARVGTSSLRRAAQLLRLRPDLRIENLRGNVDTRIRKVQSREYDAIVLAGAGLVRLGLSGQITQWLEVQTMLPAPGQGALAVECRANDAATLSLLSALEDPPARRATTAERAFLAGLGGGCAVPVAAYAQAVTGSSMTIMLGRVLSADGSQMIAVAGKDTDSEALGYRLAQDALTQGAGPILAGRS